MLLLPFDSTCIQSIDTYEMDPGLTILFSRLYILYFYFYSLLCFCFGMLGGVEYLIWDDHLVWGAYARVLCEPLCIQLEISGCL